MIAYRVSAIVDWPPGAASEWRDGQIVPIDATRTVHAIVPAESEYQAKDDLQVALLLPPMPHAFVRILGAREDEAVTEASKALTGAMIGYMKNPEVP